MTTEQKLKKTIPAVFCWLVLRFMTLSNAEYLLKVIKNLTENKAHLQWPHV